VSGLVVTLVGPHNRLTGVAGSLLHIKLIVHSIGLFGSAKLSVESCTYVLAWGVSPPAPYFTCQGQHAPQHRIFAPYTAKEPQGCALRSFKPYPMERVGCTGVLQEPNPCALHSC